MFPRYHDAGFFLGILLFGLAQLGCATTSSTSCVLEPGVPKSVEEAVDIIRSEWLSEPDRDWILRNDSDSVGAGLHHSLGMTARNEFGLWCGNSDLFASCGASHPDDCSGIIIDELWKALRAEADQKLVHDLDCQFRLTKEVEIEYRGFYQLRVGEVLASLQRQIDEQLSAISSRRFPGCELELVLQPVGDFDLDCWSRAEFSEDGDGPFPLDRFLGWYSWRNGFGTRHDPPYLELPFHVRCSWPEKPLHFQPKVEN